jgi:hypothetical protein
MKFHPSTCLWPGAVSIGREIYLNPCTNRIHRSAWFRLTAYQDADGVAEPLQLVADIVPDSSLSDFIPCSLPPGHFLLPFFIESQFSALDRIWWDLEWFIIRSSSALPWSHNNVQICNRRHAYMKGHFSVQQYVSSPKLFDFVFRLQWYIKFHFLRFEVTKCANSYVNRGAEHQIQNKNASYCLFPVLRHKLKVAYSSSANGPSLPADWTSNLENHVSRSSNNQ